jgi:phage terminase small subunit
MAAKAKPKTKPKAKHKAKPRLTDKQKAFVQEYLIDLNASAAARRAGYSVRTANRIASENLAKPHIQAAIQKAMKEREKRTEITQDKVLQELARIGLADIKDYLSYRTALTQVGVDGDGEPVIDYTSIIELVPSDDVDGTVIQEVSLSQKGVFTFKLQDKMKALELLGRHLGLFTDNVNLSGEVGVKVVDDIE